MRTKTTIFNQQLDVTISSRKIFKDAEHRAVSLRHLSFLVRLWLRHHNGICWNLSSYKVDFVAIFHNFVDFCRILKRTAFSTRCLSVGHVRALYRNDKIYPQTLSTYWQPQHSGFFVRNIMAKYHRRPLIEASNAGGHEKIAIFDQHLVSPKLIRGLYCGR